MLNDQKEHVNEYWSTTSKQVDAFKSGASVIGTTWQYNLSVAKADAPGRGDPSRRRLDRLVRHLDGGAESEHKNCAYMWLDWIAGPEASRRSLSGSARRRPT